MKNRMDLNHILQKGTDLGEVTGWERSDVSGRCLSHVLYGNFGFYAHLVISQELSIASGDCIYSSVLAQQAHSSGFYPQHHIRQV